MDRSELTAIFSSVLDELEIPFEIEEISGKNAIVIPCGNDKNSPVDCTLTLEDLGDECTAMQYLVIVAAELDRKTITELSKVMPALNLMIRIGGFGLMYDDGALYFSYSVLTDDIGTEQLIGTLLASLDVVLGVSANGKEKLLPLLSGEKSAEQLLQENLTMIV